MSIKPISLSANDIAKNYQAQVRNSKPKDTQLNLQDKKTEEVASKQKEKEIKPKNNGIAITNKSAYGDTVEISDIGQKKAQNIEEIPRKLLRANQKEKESKLNTIQ